MKYLITFLLLTNVAMAKSKPSGGLNTFVEKVSKMTGVQYIYPSEFKGKVKLSNNFSLNKKNADSTLSYILSLNGYTRVSHTDGVMKIVQSRDIRYTPTKLSSTNKKVPPKILKNYDYSMMEYTMETPGYTTEITRSLRPFMSRYGRIIDLKYANKLLIQDTGVNLYRLYGLIRGMDTSPKNGNWKEDRDFSRKLKLLKAKHCKEKE